MTIKNIENVSGNVILLLGREELVDKAFMALSKAGYGMKLTMPPMETYYQDYPAEIETMAKGIEQKGKWIIHTQSAEYIDALLESRIPFTVVTVREGTADGDELALKIRTKDDAHSDRKQYNMELRA